MAYHIKQVKGTITEIETELGTWLSTLTGDIVSVSTSKNHEGPKTNQYVALIIYKTLI